MATPSTTYTPDLTPRQLAFLVTSNNSSILTFDDHRIAILAPGILDPDFTPTASYGQDATPATTYTDD